MSKKLYRSRRNVLVAGVCAGMAEYFNQEPTFWRLGFILFLILTGLMPGVLLYIAAWIIIPKEPIHHTRDVEPENVQNS